MALFYHQWPQETLIYGNAELGYATPPLLGPGERVLITLIQPRLTIPRQGLILIKLNFYQEIFKAESLKEPHPSSRYPGPNPQSPQNQYLQLGKNHCCQSIPPELFLGECECSVFDARVADEIKIKSSTADVDRLELRAGTLCGGCGWDGTVTLV
jgi:hypothetical protein